jgi:hypothetical protein
MCVETNAVVIPLNAPVSVVFDLPLEDQREAYCLQAMVVRHTSRGAGIMFLDPEAQVVRSMRDALYGGIGSARDDLAHSEAASRARR